MSDLRTRAEAWLGELFKPGWPALDAALGAPEVETRPPPGLSPGARRAWFDEMAVQLGREHWEALAARGLVPHSWVERPSRLFVGLRAEHRADRGPTSTSYVRHVYEHPPSPDIAIAVAADAAGVATAEDLLREHLRRVGRDEASARDDAPVVWDLRASPAEPAYDCIPWQLAEALSPQSGSGDNGPAVWAVRAELRASGVPAWRAAWAAHAAWLEQLDARWRARAVARPSPTRPRTAARARPGAPSTALLGTDNPLEPLLDILRRGYGYAGADEHGRPILSGVLP